MPLPLLVPVTSLLIAVIFGTVIVIKWDTLLIMLKGKRLAVLGARGVGKTHLVKFLTTGSLPDTYKQTLGTEKVSGNRFPLKDLDLTLKETFDVAGGDDAYSEWAALVKQADVVFYLLRADRVIAGDSTIEARIKRDMPQIKRWLKNQNPCPRFFIIGTHCDLDHEYTITPDDKRGDYQDKFRVLLDQKQLADQCDKVFLGSLKTIHDTENLVFRIFYDIQKNKLT